MTVELLELAAATLADLLAQVVFVGGATVTLWITDPGAPPPRPTKDVDVIVEITTRGDFYAPRVLDGVFGALRPDAASQDRAEAVVLPALRAIASLR